MSRLRIRPAGSGRRRSALRLGGGLAAAGLAVGLAVGLPGTRIVESLLFGVTPADPVTLGGLARSQPLLNAVPEEVAREITDTPLGPHEWALRELSRTPLTTHRQVISEVGRFNSTSWLHELDLPVAIIKTTHDIAFPQWIQDEMADLLPHSAVFPIHAGHAVCATQPGNFARRMRTAIGWVVSNEHRTMRAG